MTTRAWLNLVLLLLMAGLAAVAFYAPDPEKTPANPALTHLKPADIRRIVLTRGGQEIADLSRRGNQWQITAPRRLPANDEKVQSLLRLVEEESLEHFAVAGMKLADLKLDPPEIVVRLNDVGLDIGDTDPVNGRRYVRVGDTVHLIGDTYFFLLETDLASLVDLKLLPQDASIAQLALPDMTLTATAQGGWHLEPDKPGVAADARQTLIDAWRHASALWVKPIEPGTAVGTVRIKRKDQGEWMFEIRAREPELILARPEWGLQYHFPAEQAAPLLALPSPTAADAQHATPAATPPAAPAAMPENPPAAVPPSTRSGLDEHPTRPPRP